MLAHLGLERESTIEGERGEVVHYLTGPGGGRGLREATVAGDAERYAIGLHHLAFDGGPGERDYTPGYYAVFFLDPDGLKLEVVHQPD